MSKLTDEMYNKTMYNEGTTHRDHKFVRRKIEKSKIYENIIIDNNIANENDLLFNNIIVKYHFRL